MRVVGCGHRRPLLPIIVEECPAQPDSHVLLERQQLGIETKTRQWDGIGSLVTYVISANLKRRHLSESQKAFVCVEAERLYVIEAKTRMTRSR